MSRYITMPDVIIIGQSVAQILNFLFLKMADIRHLEFVCGAFYYQRNLVTIDALVSIIWKF